MAYEYIPAIHRSIEEITADLGAIASSALHHNDGNESLDIPDNIVLGEE